MTPETFEAEKTPLEKIGRESLANFDPSNRDLLNDLIDGNYRNAFQLGYGDGQYVHVNAEPNDDSLSIADSATTFVNVWGNWGPYWAYWIFVAPEDENYTKHSNGECWTANPPNLQFWDYDGRAAYPPQDRELFHFQWADQTLGTVTIRNYQDYVAFDGNKFYVSGPSNASHFSVIFCPRLELAIPTSLGINIQQQMHSLKKLGLLSPSLRAKRNS